MSIPIYVFQPNDSDFEEKINKFVYKYATF